MVALHTKQTVNRCDPSLLDYLKTLLRHVTEPQYELGNFFQQTELRFSSIA